MEKTIMDEHIEKKKSLKKMKFLEKWYKKWCFWLIIIITLTTILISIIIFFKSEIYVAYYDHNYFEDDSYYQGEADEIDFNHPRDFDIILHIPDANYPDYLTVEYKHGFSNNCIVYEEINRYATSYNEIISLNNNDDRYGNYVPHNISCSKLSNDDLKQTKNLSVDRLDHL